MKSEISSICINLKIFTQFLNIFSLYANKTFENKEKCFLKSTNQITFLIYTIVRRFFDTNIKKKKKL